MRARNFSGALAACCVGLARILAAHAQTPPPLKVQSVEGKAVLSLVDKTHRATVWFFLTPGCPICNQYTPEINRICRDYAARQVACFAVYVAPGLTETEAQAQAQQFGLTCPVLLDSAHRLSKRAGATVTPEAAVFTPDGNRKYLGRIDNLYADVGQRRVQATTHDLRAALDAVLDGKAPAVAATQAVGCEIEPN